MFQKVNLFFEGIKHKERAGKAEAYCNLFYSTDILYNYSPIKIKTLVLSEAKPIDMSIWKGWTSKTSRHTSICSSYSIKNVLLLYFLKPKNAVGKVQRSGSCIISSKSIKANKKRKINISC